MYGVSGTIADGARLDIEIVTEMDAPYTSHGQRLSFFERLKVECEE